MTRCESEKPIYRDGEDGGLRKAAGKLQGTLTTMLHHKIEPRPPLIRMLIPHVMSRAVVIKVLLWFDSKQRNQNPQYLMHAVLHVGLRSGKV
jgi:hypothetical protein